MPLPATFATARPRHGPAMVLPVNAAFGGELPVKGLRHLPVLNPGTDCSAEHATPVARGSIAGDPATPSRQQAPLPRTSFVGEGGRVFRRGRRNLHARRMRSPECRPHGLGGSNPRRCPLLAEPRLTPCSSCLRVSNRWIRVQPFPRSRLSPFRHQSNVTKLSQFSPSQRRGFRRFLAPSDGKEPRLFGWVQPLPQTKNNKIKYDKIKIVSLGNDCGCDGWPVQLRTSSIAFL